MSSSATPAASGPERARSSASSASTRAPASRASVSQASLALSFMAPWLVAPWLVAEPMSDRQRDAGRRVRRLDYTGVAQVHVHAAGQARVEAAHRPHDVDALEA